MSAIPKRILDDVLRLPAKQRGALARVLIESLDEGRGDEGVEAAWAAEIAKRIREVRSGKVKLLSWPEVLRRARARIRGHSKS